MKIKNISIAITTGILGLLIGYFVFSNQPQSVNESAHNQVENKTSEEVWTCSMHPQIRKKEPGKCPICGMTLVPAENTNTANELVLEMTEEAIKIANIQTTRIIDEKFNNESIVVSGKIMPNEKKTASIVTHIPGRIERLYVSFTGEQVKRGQKVADIYSPILINAQRELLEADKLKNSHPNLLEAATSKLRNWKIGEDQIDAILKTQKVSETFSIYAEHSGVVNTRNVSVGDYILEGEVLFDIQNLNTVWAIFDAYENHVSRLKIGDKIAFTTTALPERTFKSKIAFIDPTINPSTRTISVRAEVENSKKLLKPEMFLRGEIQISKQSQNRRESHILVPKSAVLWTGKRSVVYVKLPRTKIPSFEFREVILGAAMADHYLVLEGLKNGEEVVTNGAFVIDASAQLNNHSSMMNRNIKKSTNL